MGSNSSLGGWYPIQSNHDTIVDAEIYQLLCTCFSLWFVVWSVALCCGWHSRLYFQLHINITSEMHGNMKACMCHTTLCMFARQHEGMYVPHNIMYVPYNFFSLLPTSQQYNRHLLSWATCFLLLQAPKSELQLEWMGVCVCVFVWQLTPCRWVPWNLTSPYIPIVWMAPKVMITHSHTECTSLAMDRQQLELPSKMQQECGSENSVQGSKNLRTSSHLYFSSNSVARSPFGEFWPLQWGSQLISMSKCPYNSTHVQAFSSQLTY